MNSNNNNHPNQNNGNDTAFAIGIAALVGCAVWTQKEAQIRFWLYQNLMAITFYAMVVVALLVLYAVYRIKKKNQEELARIRAVQSVKPSRNPRNYYERDR